MTPTKKWRMPKWMRRYAPLIVNTGGNDIEEMVNDRTDPVVNLPRAVLAACVKSQVSLLTRLRSEGELGACAHCECPEAHR